MAAEPVPAAAVLPATPRVRGILRLVAAAASEAVPRRLRHYLAAGTGRGIGRAGGPPAGPDPGPGRRRPQAADTP